MVCSLWVLISRKIYLIIIYGGGYGYCYAEIFLLYCIFGEIRNLFPMPISASTTRHPGASSNTHRFSFFCKFPPLKNHFSVEHSGYWMKVFPPFFIRMTVHVEQIILVYFIRKSVDDSFNMPENCEMWYSAPGNLILALRAPPLFASK